MTQLQKTEIRLSLKKQIRIAIGSAALVCSLGYATGAFADDWENYKNSVGIEGLVQQLSSTAYSDFKKNLDLSLGSLNTKNTKLIELISTKEKNINTLSKLFQNKSIQLGKYEYTSALRSSGQNPQQSTLKALETLSGKISNLKLDIHSNVTAQTDLQNVLTTLSKEQSLIETDISKFSKSSAVSTDLANVGSKFKSVFTSLDIAGKATTVLDIYAESMKIQLRVREGSTNDLEAWNLALKGADFIIPSLPCFDSVKKEYPKIGAALCSSPNDLGRYMIDYYVALKGKNKAFVNGADMTQKVTNEFTIGDASIDQYIYRRLQNEKISFDVTNLTNSINTTYENLKTTYINNHLNVILKNFKETRAVLVKERDDAWLPSIPATTGLTIFGIPVDPRETAKIIGQTAANAVLGKSDVKIFFDSLLKDMDSNIKKLEDEKNAILKDKKGFATVYDYATIATVKNEFEGVKQIDVSSIEIKTTQAELAKSVADKANQTASSLKNISTKVNEVVVKPTTPVTVIPAVKLTGTKGDAQVILKWNKTANAVVQSICYSTTSQTVNSLSLLDCKVENGYTLLENQASPAIVNKLTNGKKYYFAIITDDTNRNVTSSNIVSLIPKGETFPKTGYTKIANDGSKLPDSANLGANPKDWACTRDNKTGLTWEVKTSDGGLRDMNNRYSWYEPDANKNGGFAGYQNGNGHPEWCKGSECDTYAFTNAVNTQGLCGAKDWRVPMVDELMKLVLCSDGKYDSYDGGCTNWKTVRIPTINTMYFPNILDTPESNYYHFWSSSPLADFSNDARFVCFEYGYSCDGYKDSDKVIRLVR